MFFDFLGLLFGRIFFFTGVVKDDGNFPKPLSPEDESKYLRLAREGDTEARNMLIKHNMRLVAHIVKKYTGSAETDDLLSVGSIGLIKAINTFQDGKGTQLATYTARCIENEILMLLRAGKKHKNSVSLSEPVGVDKDGNELTLIDLLSEKEDSVFAQVEKSIQREKFVACLKKFLTEREFVILSLRYGLEDGVALPQREVAKKLGISRSYISRIEKRAIEKARERLNKEDFFND
ncbi:MAG: RNA polymerase sporulation sigma factor SigK [Clostridia bacterium]|nr:RNA polymerase sporulation sigma factor SigK [Clostridia bacterium]